jgi:lysophospholipase L1-like esterase
MLSKSISILWLSLLLGVQVFAQNSQYVWWNPQSAASPVVEGQAWPKELKNPYDRLPARAEKQVRDVVWNLSNQSAGLMIRFRANSPEIKVRYAVGGKHALPHMPATGVSGVDLYAVSNDGDWRWCAGKYAFGDTITYDFRNLAPNDDYHKHGREYRLFLPLYNSVKWLEIGTPIGTEFIPLTARPDKPIVIYGTSIAQGACASRPGMAWTSILERRLDHPVINLGFSGNGRLEKELIDLVVEIDAKAYVLDCLPNLTSSTDFPLAEVKKRIIASVHLIRDKHPRVPVILTEYPVLTDQLNAAKIKTVTGINGILREAFADLKAAGINHIYIQEVRLEMDDTVDGTHPTDMGMQHYADAYEKNLRAILHEPAGKSTTTIPCRQYRDAAIYDWASRHKELLDLNTTAPPKIVFMGNSITHYWGGIPKAPLSSGADSWNGVLHPAGARNFGYGWDRIENVLWRVYHDELNGFNASQIILMIGTNNLGLNTNEEIIEGLDSLVHAIQYRQPHAAMLLMALLPRKGLEPRVRELNIEIMKLSRRLNITGADAGKLFLNKDGKIIAELFSDGLHPNAKGYQLLADFLKPKLKKGNDL